jgi:hypothetical protein
VRLYDRAGALLVDKFEQRGFVPVVELARIELGRLLLHDVPREI